VFESDDDGALVAVHFCRIILLLYAVPRGRTELASHQISGAFIMNDDEGALRRPSHLVVARDAESVPLRIVCPLTSQRGNALFLSFGGFGFSSLSRFYPSGAQYPHDHYGYNDHECGRGVYPHLS
jgi:hypothetical protein